MKKITLLFILLAVSFGYSQQVLIEDFESSPALHSWSGAAVAVGNDAVSSNGQNMEVTLVAAAGDPWQGAAVTLPAGTVMDLTTDKTVTVDVYSTIALTIMGKVESNSGAAASAVDSAHGGAGWQTITFDFTSNNQDGTGPANGEYNLFAVFPNRDGAGGWGNPVIGSVTQYDNLTAVLGVPAETCTDGIQNNGETDVDCGGPNCDPCPVPPSTAAPTPPARLEADVLSIFSSSMYTDVTASGINTFAGASWDNITIESTDDTRRLTAPNPGGGAQYEYFGASPALDLTDFSHLHVDFYVEGSVAPGQLFQVFLLNFPNYPDGAGATNLNTSFDVNALGSGTWISGDVELSTFGGDLTRDKVALVQLVAAGAPAFGPIYIDNIYFHKNTTLGLNDLDSASFNVYPNPSNNVWNVKTNNTIINSVQVFDILGKQVVSLTSNSNEVQIDASTLNTGLYFARIESNSGTKTIKLIKK